MSKFFAICIAVAAFSVGAQEFASFQEMNNAGVAADKAKDYEKMRSIYSAWYKKAGSDYQKWCCVVGEVRALRSMKKYDDAIKVIDDFIAAKPTATHRAMVIFLKGIVLDEKEDDAAAILMFEEALKEPSIYSYAKEQSHHKLMTLQFTAKQYDKSIEHAKILLADKSVIRETAYFYYAQSLFEQKKFAEAEKVAKEGLGVAKDKYVKHQLAYIYANLLLEQDKEDDAVKYFKEVIELHPKGWRSINAKKILEEFE